MDPTIPEPGLFRSGRRVGHYVLLERIGEGGMGEVWRAEQRSPVRRTVALKLIRPGMDSREILARFEAERQALAMMDHPSIAKVFDAGTTPEGRPYFAMEYVPGVSITEYCDRRCLGVEQRLRLFQRVCQGVQHAHQKAVLHRDLKPSNVLVTDEDDQPRPKIIDFGVAKAMTQQLTDKSMHTAMGQLIGTPEFVSPEQADLTIEDVDTRSDVYSLGVILYVLLTGALPFASEEFRRRGVPGIVRILRERDPPRPSARFSTLGADSAEVARCRRIAPGQLLGQLRGDLDWIVLRCLEKDRNRRYGSALELAQDIQRFLGHQPIVARPPSPAYRARKFARRHRLGVGITASLILALVVFSSAMAIQSARIAAQRDRANQEAQLSQEVSGFLTQLFEIADPQQSRGASITAREILDRGAERIGHTEWTDPMVQSRLVSLMSSTYSGLGLYQDASALSTRAWELDRDHLGDRHPVTLEARSEMGAALMAEGSYEQAESILREALGAQRSVAGPEAIATARTEARLARLLRNLGHNDEALPLYQQALEAHLASVGAEDRDTARIMNELGILYWVRGDYTSAEPLLVRSLDIAESKLGEDHPATLSFRNNMAAFEDTATHWADPRPHRARAESLYRQCLATQRRILGDDHPETLRTAYNLGTLLLNQGRLDEARPLLEEAATGRRRVLGDDHRATWFAQINLANVWRQLGRTGDAEGLLLSVLDRQQAVLDPNHVEIYYTVSELYEICLEEDRQQEARSYMRRMISIRKEEATKQDASAEAHHRYARTLLDCPFDDLRDTAAALDHATRASELGGGHNPAHLRTLARAQALSGDREAACRTMESALLVLPAQDPGRAGYERELALYRTGGSF